MTSDGSIFLQRGFIPAKESNNLFIELRNEIKWRSDEIRMFGRTIPIPRLNAWYGDEGCSYSYSGIKLDPLPWTETLKNLRNRVAEAAEESFNSALLNLYRDGSDSNGWHADDEPELGEQPVIASLSLGATRLFKMKRRDGLEKISLELANGDLLIMNGDTQSFWLHQIPKVAREIEERINLTFRKVAMTTVNHKK